MILDCFRFFRQFILLFAVHFTSISMFRCIAAIFQTGVASMTAGSFAMLITFVFAGFAIPYSKIFALSSFQSCSKVPLKHHFGFFCSRYASVVEVGFLGKSYKLRRDWALCKRVSCSAVAASDSLSPYLFPLIIQCLFILQDLNQFSGYVCRCNPRILPWDEPYSKAEG